MQSKSKKVEEWKNFPMSTDEQRHAWWLWKRELINVPSANSSPYQPDILQATSPSTNGPAFDENSSPGITFPSLRQVQSSVQGVQPWNPELNGPANYDMGVTLEGSDASNAFLASDGLQDMASSTERHSPGVRTSDADRWRKYF